MVKGTSRQVIVVRPPNTDLFDQAIFILKDKVVESGGITDEEILHQAREAADNYLRNKAKGGRAVGVKIKPVIYALLGALAASVIWGLCMIIF